MAAKKADGCQKLIEELAARWDVNKKGVVLLSIAIRKIAPLFG